MLFLDIYIVAVRVTEAFGVTVWGGVPFQTTTRIQPLFEGPGWKKKKSRYFLITERFWRHTASKLLFITYDTCKLRNICGLFRCCCHTRTTASINNYYQVFITYDT